MSKKDKKGCGCVATVVLLYLGLSAGWGGYEALTDYLAQVEERKFRAQWAIFFDPFDAAENHLAAGDFLQAISASEEALAAALANPSLGTTYVARAYERKARGHIQLWQYVDAEAALQKALPYAQEDLHADLSRRLAEVQGRITDNDTERNEQHIYHASPGIGPAQTLHGKVVIAYVFVGDGANSTWSLKTQQYVLTHLERVKQWIQAEAGKYNRPGITFTERIFRYDQDPWLRNALPNLSSENTEIGYDLAHRVATLQNAPSVNTFLYRLAREEEADQAILLLHVNLNKRSFAHRCWTGCPDRAEYAYLLKSTERRHWDAVAYVQAHEALHLFGADDLYNLQGGSHYAPRDIMHHNARYIEASIIDSLTAFGVGWLDQAPRPTPFPIQKARAAP